MVSVAGQEPLTLPRQRQRSALRPSKGLPARSRRDHARRPVAYRQPGPSDRTYRINRYHHALGHPTGRASLTDSLGVSLTVSLSASLQSLRLAQDQLSTRPPPLASTLINRVSLINVGEPTECRSPHPPHAPPARLRRAASDGRAHAPRRAASRSVARPAPLPGPVYRVRAPAACAASPGLACVGSVTSRRRHDGAAAWALGHSGDTLSRLRALTHTCTHARAHARTRGQAGRRAGGQAGRQTRRHGGSGRRVPPTAKVPVAHTDGRRSRWRGPAGKGTDRAQGALGQEDAVRRDAHGRHLPQKEGENLDRASRGCDAHPRHMPPAARRACGCAARVGPVRAGKREREKG